jgi:bidirectional [NiFe] hydrogenase diaphorase subunit
MKVTLFIDSKMVRVEKETPLIHVARMLGIRIPTLCYHEALKPYGACRLCVVEVVRGTHSRLVTSCNYPAQEGIEVFTDTPEVRTSRRLTMELLLARCPDVPVLKEIARQIGVSASRFKVQRDEKCILCGLCVRVCDEVVGATAIGLGDRGIDRVITTPFGDPAQTCIGCGSCTYLCPTGCIEMESHSSGMTLKMTGHTLSECQNDGQCSACATDEVFLRRMKEAISAFRCQL